MKLQITIDGKAYEVEVEVLEDDSTSRLPSYESYHPAAMAAPSMQFPGAAVQSPIAEEGVYEEKVCRSPVTGIVIKVHVEPGQVVEPNTLIMVLEAMKMETSITAPRAGIVKDVRVAQGDSVKFNQVVVEFE